MFDSALSQRYKHIVWSVDLEKLDFSKPSIRRWWITTVLREGTARDIAELDFEEVKRLLPSLYLPKPVKDLWAAYFDSRKSQSGAPPPPSPSGQAQPKHLPCLEPGMLTDAQKEILKVFAETEGASEFYLTGGTALAAFYLHHRYSEDLDLFTGKEDLVPITSRAFERNLEREGFALEVLLRTSSFVRLLISKGGGKVKVEIAQDTPYRLAPVVRTEYGVNVDSLEDIAANKMLALFGRAEPRDFVDVYFLVKEYFDFPKLLEMAGRKDTGFDEYWLAIALRQIEDMEELPVAMRAPFDFDAMKTFFLSEANKIMERIKGGKQDL